VNYEAVRYLADKGRIVFLFDSFDEMAQILRRNTVRENLRTPRRVTRNSRAIMTVASDLLRESCRTPAVGRNEWRIGTGSKLTARISREMRRVFLYCAAFGSIAICAPE